MGRRPSLALLGLWLACVAGTAFAHDDAWMDRQQAPNGGKLRMAGPLHLELVRAPAAAVYVTDHAGQALDTAGAEGTLALERDGESRTVILQSAGANLLKPASPLRLAADEPVVLSVKLAGAGVETARFAPPGSSAPASPSPALPAPDHNGHH